MKKQFWFLPILVFLLFNCKKSESNLQIHCQGLVMDTAGMGNTAFLFLPSAFTPNNDGLNDIIRPITQNITAIEFTIFDEKNQAVFKTTTVGQGWSTSASPNTTTHYFYKIQATTTSQHKIGLCGDLFKLTCLPAGTTLNKYTFEDQLTPWGFTGVTNENLGNCPQ